MDIVNTNYRILNLEGAWLENNGGEFIFNSNKERVYTKKGKRVKIKPRKDKLYSATMPYSLETYRAFGSLPSEVLNDKLEVADEDYIESGKELFTKLFVNFKFTKDLFDDNNHKTNKKKLRKLLYTSTVKIDKIEYCFFKRGASKARTANVIFVKKEYYETLLKPCLLGLSFEEGKRYDITSKEAYTSLIMSGIIGIISIPRESILMIDDLESTQFKAIQTKTKMNEDRVVYQDDGEEEGFDVINNMSDGQVLADESIYLENEILNKATCALLRNDFFKGNAVRTKLQEHYKENNITKVCDKYRGWMDADKIKLVVTPSAVKYLKFANQFKDEESCFKNWLEKIPTEFGLVKIDHIGNYGYSNRLSYQMINSMDLSREEVKQLAQDELDYFKLLNDNTLATSEDIKKMSKKDKTANRKIRNQMSYFLDLIKSDEEDLSTSDMVTDLLQRNNDFRLTKKFKNWKDEQLQDYMENLRLGKIRIKNSIYAIMISCPYEMLVSTYSEKNKISECIMTGWECYCPRFGENVELLAIRNPQINAGNIGHMINKYHDEYKWFGYYEEGQAKHDFVVFVNTYDADLMNRLQGADFDIDSCLLTDNKLLVLKAKESQNYPTPVNGIEGCKEIRVYNNKSLADLDNYLGGSTMAIGKIVNKSAIFNAYMYHAMNKGYDKGYIDSCYKASSTLSSFSQIAIDMAKKSFEGLSLTKEMNNLNKTSYKNDKGENIQILDFKKEIKTISINEYNEHRHELIKLKYCYNDETNSYVHMYEVAEKKMIVPYFFTYIAKDNSYRMPTYMECGMDYLEEVLDNTVTKARSTDVVIIKELLVMQKDLEGSKFSKKDMDEVRKIIDKCNTILNRNISDVRDREEEVKFKNNIKKWAKKETINKLKELKLNDKTIYRIVLRALDSDDSYEGNEIKKKDKEGNETKYLVKELKEMTMLTLTLIHKSYKKEFLNCFKEKKLEKVKIDRYWN